LRTATDLLPNLRHLALIYGASAIELTRWAGYGQMVREAGLEPIELVGLSVEETRAAVGRLPPDTAALVLGPIVDARGTVQSVLEVCGAVAASGTVPTLTTEVHNLGCGALGGLLRDWGVIGRLLGREAASRLRNPSAAVVRVPVPRYTTMVFDDRELRRWDIAERQLPAGAVVQFRDPDLWRDRRPLVLAVAAVALVQSLLIAWLVFERRRRRRAEVESRRDLTALAHLDRRAAMGELATSLAHELNQPLNAILQNAGVAQMLLAAQPLPTALAEMPEIIGDIRNDDIRASDVIRRLRALLEKHEPESRPVDVNELAQDTAALVRSDARARDIQLELELKDGVPLVSGDRVHLQQVLLNLLMNAMDAVVQVSQDRRQVRVRVSQTDREVRLAVADRGPGIQAERPGEIFEPFYTTKGEGAGMGMGLAIARRIVEAHSGRMGAENNGGEGATVWFSLPVARAGPA
jgi:signal transduction histidine kinase